MVNLLPTGLQFSPNLPGAPSAPSPGPPPGHLELESGFAKHDASFWMSSELNFDKNKGLQQTM